MRFNGHGRQREEARIDLTAMLDVVFNLLLFFVVTTSFAEEDQTAKKDTPGIQVDLPQSGAQAILSDDRDINVWMTADGAVFLDDQPVDMQGLRDVFRDRAARDPQTLVVIKADEGVTHGRVVQVMDQAKIYGLSKLAIATEARTAEPDETP